jgi:hypothetical protein
MIQIIWEFVVKAEAVEQFEKAYGPERTWARLFQAYPGFRGTTSRNSESGVNRSRKV